MDVPRRYGLLRAVAVVLKVVAWIVLIAGIVAGIFSLLSVGGSSTPLPRTLWVAGIILGPLLSLLWFVQLYAFGSVLSLLIDIERNTHQLTAEAALQ